MFPSRCIHDPCRNIEVSTLPAWRPGSVTHTRLSPIGKPEPGGSNPVSSPGMRPRLHTDLASGTSEPAPCTKSQTRRLMAMTISVTTAVRRVRFSSW